MPVTVATTVDDGVTPLPLPAAADSTRRPRTADRTAAAAAPATAATDRRSGGRTGATTDGPRGAATRPRRPRRRRTPPARQASVTVAGGARTEAADEHAGHRTGRPRALRAARGRPRGAPARVPRRRRRAGAHAPDPARARRGGGAARAEGRARDRAPHRRQPADAGRLPHGRDGGPADGPGRPRPAPRLGAGPGRGRGRRRHARPRPRPRPQHHQAPAAARARRSRSAASTPSGPSRPRSPVRAPASAACPCSPSADPRPPRTTEEVIECRTIKASRSPEPGSGDSINRTDPGGSMGNDTFLKLLVAQMKYQDPLQPTDSAQMMSQLAQFSLGRGPQQPQPADHRARPQPGLQPPRSP